MLSLSLMFYALVVSVVTLFVVAYRDKYHSVPDEVTWGKVGFIKWIYDEHHWHTFGHFMLDFTTTVIIAVMWFSMAAYLGEYVGWFHALIFSHPIVFSFLCMLAPTALVFYQELIYDRHLWGFLGKEEHDTFDFFFDIFTHVAGGATASLLIAALLVALI